MSNDDGHSHQAVVRHPAQQGQAASWRPWFFREASMDAQADIMARTLWGEARGEGRAGMAAVASVICSRARIAREHMRSAGRVHPLFGNGTHLAVCLWPWQFSCWLPGDPNLRRMLSITTADPRFSTAVSVALQALSGGLADPTGEATHYHATSITPPSWATGEMPTVTIGQHVFYRLP